MHTLIIGGGAAGMAAAIAAARAGQAVTVLERGRRPLKKLGVTGNGRGNLLNAGAPDYPGGADFAAQVLAAMPYERLAAFWEELGVPLRLEEEGGCIPRRCWPRRRWMRLGWLRAGWVWKSSSTRASRTCSPCPRAALKHGEGYAATCPTYRRKAAKPGPARWRRKVRHAGGATASSWRQAGPPRLRTARTAAPTRS